MKILLISKYPPIEGGVSSGNYWLARELGERGHEISIVTNSLSVENEYREKINLTQEYGRKMLEPKNVRLYSLEKNPPHHIPFSEAYLSRLVNMGLRAIGERGADVIYAHYLEPYGAAGFILKKLTGLPLVLRHAGSDIYRLLKDEDFKYFFGRVIQGADHLFFSRIFSAVAGEFKITPKKITSIAKAIDVKFFTPDGGRMDFSKYGADIPKNIPVITYIGKTANHKGLVETFEALSGIHKDFRLLFISNGREKLKQEIISRAREKLRNKFVEFGFVPPWEIPLILRSSSLLLQLENNFPIPIHGPTQPAEGIACGTPLLLSNEIFQKITRPYRLSPEDVYLAGDVQDVSGLRRIFEDVLSNSAQSRYKALRAREKFLAVNDWDKFVDTFETVLSSVLRKKWF